VRSTLRVIGPDEAGVFALRRQLDFPAILAHGRGTQPAPAVRGRPPHRSGRRSAHLSRPRIVLSGRGGAGAGPGGGGVGGGGGGGIVSKWIDSDLAHGQLCAAERVKYVQRRAPGVPSGTTADRPSARWPSDRLFSPSRWADTSARRNEQKRRHQRRRVVRPREDAIVNDVSRHRRQAKPA